MLTNQQTVEQFNELWIDAEANDHSLIGDEVAKRTAYNDYTDYLCTDGQITDSQYNSMPNTF